MPGCSLFKEDMSEMQKYSHSWIMPNGLADWHTLAKIYNHQEKKLNHQLDEMARFMEINQSFSSHSCLQSRGHGTEKVVHVLSNMDFYSPKPT
jgi:hypothetical protein